MYKFSTLFSAFHIPKMLSEEFVVGEAVPEDEHDHLEDQEIFL